MLPVCLGAADAVVVAGGARFGAHSALLAAHSGYFRAAIAERDPSADENLLYVPNVSAQQFWPLLAYMYTGYLELSPDNIYQVLLATHLLHMPRALELCRNFLAAGGAAPQPTPTLVKPIPSRKPPPFLSHGLFRPIYAENAFAYHRQSLLPTSEAPQPVPFAPENKEAPRSPVVEVVAEEERVETAPPPIQIPKIKKVQKTAAVRNRSPDTSKGDETAEESSKKSQQPQTAADKVVVDIACCDGPVRFHRVLNDAYKIREKIDSVADASDSDDSYVEIEEDSLSRGESASFGNATSFNRSLQKQMNENIRMNHRGGRNENRDDSLEKSANSSEASSKRQPDAVYTCVYCNHTFKSQYCYQKHARRHLNPVSIDAVDEDPSHKSRSRLPAVKSPIGPRREVKLLDMNVQYYPCKTCGSKFPSYYFVHKHRKMCHAEELEGAVEGTKTNPVTDRKRKISVTTTTTKDKCVNEQSEKPTEGTG